VGRVNANALEVRNLVKSYSNKPAVRDVSFSADFGAITAVLGPNGAGKTTTIECCEGLRDPDGGSIKILGKNPRVASSQIRSRIGVMLQDGGLPMAVPAGNVLRHVGRLYADAGRRREKQLIATLDLAGHLRTPVRRLSGGNRQRLALACALIGEPEVLFLDEPTAGMDPHARVAVHDLITEVKNRGTAIILTTHLLDEAEALADQVILMAEGKIAVRGTVEEITAGERDGIDILFGRPTTRKELASGLARGLELSGTSQTSGRAWQITPVPTPSELAQFMAHLASIDLEVHELKPKTDLTSLFLRLAGGSDTGANK